MWRKVRGDWEAWNQRSLADEPIVRLILDGTVVRVRLDKRATAISLPGFETMADGNLFDVKLRAIEKDPK